jgi:hypothetical protein
MVWDFSIALMRKEFPTAKRQVLGVSSEVTADERKAPG